MYFIHLFMKFIYLFSFKFPFLCSGQKKLQLFLCLFSLSHAVALEQINESRHIKAAIGVGGSCAVTGAAIGM
jgi:hypothetical protein